MITDFDTAIPLPTVLDRYSVEQRAFDMVNVRMIFGTKVWCMTTDELNRMLKTETIEIARIDADMNVVVRYA